MADVPQRPGQLNGREEQPTNAFLADFVAVSALLLATGLCAAAAPSLPLPRMVVPKASAGPTIDGKMAPREWDRAAAATAFTVAFHGQLAKNQSVVWVTYDDERIYVCFRNHRGEHDVFLSRKARADDDAAIVFDHSNEIWITPPGAPQATYQTLFNAYPGVYDVKMIPSVGYTAKSWRGRWKMASSETADHWIVEAAAPISSFGAAAIADGAVWRGLFTTDVLGKGGGFRAWAPGGAFAETNRHGRLEFRHSGAAFQLLDVETAFTGRLRLPMAVAGATNAAAKVTVTVRCGAGVKASGGDLVLTKAVDVPAGRRKTFELAGDLTKLALPMQKVVVQNKPRVEKEFPRGFCEVTAADGGDVVLYHQVFPFTIDGSVRRPPAKIKTTPYETPFGLAAYHAPLSKKLLVKIDRYYMTRRGEAVAGRARLICGETHKVVAERPIAPFRRDYSQFPIDVGGLNVPVQTEQHWADAQPIVAENKRIEAENKKRAARGEKPLPLRPPPGPEPARYTLAVGLTGADGRARAQMSIPVDLLGYRFEWLGNSIGKSDRVIPPWTPVKAAAGEVTTWNKRYKLNGLGLAEMIVNAGRRQLSGPMRLVAVVDGKEFDVTAGAGKVASATEAAVELVGGATVGGAKIDVSTRVAFDGCVVNTLRLCRSAAAKSAKLERLSLIVRMPASEAPCFVTTAGGWSAQHGWTPARWDSRETSAASRVGNFVPYVFLTDSDRGFCWFADTDKGWMLDPNAPTQEVVREGETVTLKVHFVTRPTDLAGPTELTYGWMVTPQKPQPPGWRATHINYHKPYPKARCVFYNDADWAVLWPYYCSPFPWSYEKSKKMLDGAKANGVVPHVGNIAHAIARYRDHKGRWFNELAADWGSTPGDRSNGNVTRCPAVNDFQLWHFDRWVKQSGLPGIYFDENYLDEEYNYLSGQAYLLPGDRVQPAYSYLGLREYNKRLRYMFHANGYRPPYLWLHTTSGQPVYAWMPDVAMEGENVAPTGMDNDYISCLPASRLRSIGMGRNLGAAAIIMCQADRHYKPAFGDFMVEQFVGWVLAHDCLPESNLFWPVLAGELEMWHEEIRFLPYWKGGSPVSSKTKDVLVSAHARDGHAVLWIVNTARKNCRAVVEIDLKRLGLAAGKTIAFDAETGQRRKLAGGAPRKLTVDVPQRMWRAVRLMQPRRLTGETTFIAAFDGAEVAADEAFGHCYGHCRDGKTVSGGRGGGRAVALDKEIRFDTRHHLAAETGSVSLAAWLPDARARGTLLSFGKQGPSLRIDRGRVKLCDAKRKALAEAELKLGDGGRWVEFHVRWRGRDVSVRLNGTESLTAKLPSPLPIAPMGRGLAIQNNRERVRPTQITFGPIPGARLDDLRMAAR